MPSLSRRTLLAAVAPLTVPASAQGKRPNIVFILADDMGSADLSCYGRRDHPSLAGSQAAPGSPASPFRTPG